MVKNGLLKKVMLIILSAILVISILLVVGYIYIRNTIFVKPNNKSNVQEYKKGQILDSVLEGHKDDNQENIQQITDENAQNNNEHNNIIYNEQKGIINLLLIGTDARESKEQARSDSIIIATIDSNRKKVKFSSILRDLYVDIPNYKSQKINAALILGGPELLMSTIEKNFNIKLDKYIMIDFWGFEDVVNVLGGIDIDVKNYEIEEMNKYIGEYSSNKSPRITVCGLQHLDGQQALSYARIRKVGDGIYERSKRQSEILFIVSSKLKDIRPIKYVDIFSQILPHIKTNIEPANFLNYIYTVGNFSPLITESFQIPLTELSDGRIYKGSWVLLMDKNQNAKIVNEYIFQDKKPSPEDLDLKGFKTIINNYINNSAKNYNKQDDLSSNKNKSDNKNDENKEVKEHINEDDEMLKETMEQNSEIKKSVNEIEGEYIDK